MTSNREYNQAYVWIWLPEEVHPVVAGRLFKEGNDFLFNYGRSYLERIHDEPAAIPIYFPELPLKEGVLPLIPTPNIPGCLRDSAPDAWGRRVIINRKFGRESIHTDTAVLDELTYLLESGSDRIGALDYQLSPTVYEPRAVANASLEERIRSAERVENGVPLTPELDQALYYGSSIGGARPKALIEDENNHLKYIAKFSSSSDVYSVVKAEYIAMRLARLAGLNVADVEMRRSANKDVLLIKRFDREYTERGWTRKLMVSALTLFGLDEMMARYASYETLAEIIRLRSSQPKVMLKELFSRLCFNVLSGNTDDHARNHATFWDGKYLELTPAYDICPQGRSGNEATQAMLINGNNRLSQRSTCLAAAHHFLLTESDAVDIFEHQIDIIESNWQRICDEAELSVVERNLFWRRQFLNPFSLL